jgi:DNA-binding transcriptional LysR family regulator
MKIDEMQLLIRVAETGSMTRAARQLDRTPAAVSAAIQRIERALGLRLFERTTRTLHPTDEGLVIVEGCQETVRRWQQTLDEARGSNATLEGSIRLSAPTDATQQVVAEAVAAFSAAHASVRVIVHATDTLQNVLEDALDVSVRYGELKDSSLVSRRLAASLRILVASPDYLARRGVPETLDDLAQHRLLTLQLASTPVRTWPLEGDRGSVPLAVDSPLCGDGLVVRRWAVAGQGIAFKSLLDVIDDLEAGRLVRVLPGFDGAVGPIHAVLPSRTYIPARVRALVAHLATEFAAREARCARWLSPS